MKVCFGCKHKAHDLTIEGRCVHCAQGMLTALRATKGSTLKTKELRSKLQSSILTVNRLRVKVNKLSAEVDRLQIVKEKIKKYDIFLDEKARYNHIIKRIL